MKPSIGISFVVVAVVFISGCRKPSTPEQSFDSIMALVREVKSGNNPDTVLDRCFYRTPHEKEGYGDVERIKARALYEVILSRIASYSFGEKILIDASTVQLTINFSNKDHPEGVDLAGTKETTFVFVKDGREWKMDCGPRSHPAQDNGTNVAELVSDLRNNTDARSAILALIKMGSPAVPEILRALEAIPPAVDNEADASLLFCATTTLVSISQKEPSIMGDAVSCLLHTARRTSNKNAKELIIFSIRQFGPSVVSPLMAFLDSEVKNPAPEDPDTMIAQGLVSIAIINLMKENPLETDAVIEQLKKCLDTASDKMKMIIVAQIATLSPASKSVVVILQEQLQTAKDPALKNAVEAALEFARKKSPQ
jgi:hypothetical protein